MPDDESPTPPATWPSAAGPPPSARRRLPTMFRGLVLGTLVGVGVIVLVAVVLLAR